MKDKTMNFASAVLNQSARTDNGMKARASTSSPCVDLFFKAGAMRGKDIIPTFAAAFGENPERALRIAQWLRDARQGAGERTLYRNIVNYLETINPDLAKFLIYKAPELGRWDDVVETPQTESVANFAYNMASDALQKGNGLAAKWLPRKGPLAAKLRSHFGMSPKQYRKTIVGLTHVVEQLMCGKKWDEINFSHVPSLAHARYKKSFIKNAASYQAYVESLVKGEKGVKINAGAVYPYDVIKGWKAYGSATANAVIDAQWNALPDYVGDASILPIIDTSGSMTTRAGGYSSKSETTCLDVAVSLGLYVASKNKGAFKDIFFNFSTHPKIYKLTGDSITNKLRQINRNDWEQSTNLHAAMELMLRIAVEGKVAQEDMPKVLLIMSDMQFNSCTRYDDSAHEMIVRKYTQAGYEAPKVVFWNINAAENNVPVAANTQNVGLVSGFSPAIVRSVLAAKEFTPEAIMLETIMNPRYDIS